MTKVYRYYPHSNHLQNHISYHCCLFTKHSSCSMTMAACTLLLSPFFVISDHFLPNPIACDQDGLTELRATIAILDGDKPHHHYSQQHHQSKGGQTLAQFKLFPHTTSSPIIKRPPTSTIQTAITFIFVTKRSTKRSSFYMPTTIHTQTTKKPNTFNQASNHTYPRKHPNKSRINRKSIQNIPARPQPLPNKQQSPLPVSQAQRSLITLINNRRVRRENISHPIPQNSPPPKKSRSKETAVFAKVV